MFCPNCGTQQADNVGFCGNCGQPLSAPEQSQPVSMAAPTQEVPAQAPFQEEKGDSMKKPASIVRLLVLAAVILMFFPFVMISCSGSDLEISGAELMTTITFNEQLASATDDMAPNIFLIITEIAGLVALASFARSRVEDKLLISGFLSAVSTACLILFRVTFMSMYELEGSYVDVEFRWGFVLCLLAYIAAAVISLYSLSKYSEHGIGGNAKMLFGGASKGMQANVNNTMQNVQPNGPENQAAAWVCDCCGSVNSNSDSNCKGCGQHR